MIYWSLDRVIQGQMMTIKVEDVTWGNDWLVVVFLNWWIRWTWERLKQIDFWVLKLGSKSRLLWDKIL